jgi:hypothetical protein
VAALHVPLSGVQAPCPFSTKIKNPNSTISIRQFSPASDFRFPLSAFRFPLSSLPCFSRHFAPIAVQKISNPIQNSKFIIHHSSFIIQNFLDTSCPIR